VSSTVAACQSRWPARSSRFPAPRSGRGVGELGNPIAVARRQSSRRQALERPRRATVQKIRDPAAKPIPWQIQILSARHSSDAILVDAEIHTILGYVRPDIRLRFSEHDRTPAAVDAQQTRSAVEKLRRPRRVIAAAISPSLSMRADVVSVFAPNPRMYPLATFSLEYRPSRVTATVCRSSSNRSA
jgi:hypothetical protein